MVNEKKNEKHKFKTQNLKQCNAIRVLILTKKQKERRERETC